MGYELEASTGGAGHELDASTGGAGCDLDASTGGDVRAGGLGAASEADAARRRRFFLPSRSWLLLEVRVQTERRHAGLAMLRGADGALAPETDGPGDEEHSADDDGDDDLDGNCKRIWLRFKTLGTFSTVYSFRLHSEHAHRGHCRPYIAPMTMACLCSS